MVASAPTDGTHVTVTSGSALHRMTHHGRHGVEGQGAAGLG